MPAHPDLLDTGRTDRRFGWFTTSRAARAGIVAAFSVLVWIVDMVRRTSYTLDDWLYLRNASLEGAWHAGDQGQWFAARPVAKGLYAFIYGVIGHHPALAVTTAALINLAFVLVLWRLLEEFFEPGIAVITAAGWSVFANHTSLEVWICCSDESLALFLGTAGLLIGLRRRDHLGAAAAGVLVAASMLSYQAVIPVLGVGILLLPWLKDRKLDRRLIGWCALFGGPALAWIVSIGISAQESFPGYKNFGAAIPAHFGWGIVPRGPFAAIVGVVSMLGVVATIWLAATGRLSARQRGHAYAVGAGLVIIVLGLLPFANYYYAPIGAGDRVSVVTSVGGALTWAGLIGLAWTVRRAIAVIGVAVLLVGVSITRWDRIGLWHLAGCDAQAVLDYVVEVRPHPTGTLALYPGPPREDNIMAFPAPADISAAAQYSYQNPRPRAYFAGSEAQFLQAPPSQRVRIPDSVWCEGRTPHR